MKWESIVDNIETWTLYDTIITRGREKQRLKEERMKKRICICKTKRAR